jgi:cytochrome b561
MDDKKTNPARSAGAADSYTTTQRLLHWIIVGLISAQYMVGAIMPHIGRNTPNEGWVNWHLSLGAAILLFVVLRLLMRFTRPVALLDSEQKWQRQLAAATHLSLYVLVLAMCVLGWAAASFQGWTIYLFGLIPLPSLAAKGTAWAHTAGDAHDILLYVLLIPIALHIIAALYHHFVLRDRLLDRMTVGIRRGA